jgi:tRNA A-37 threonylcarbamoyl transferase component Bud32
MWGGISHATGFQDLILVKLHQFNIVHGDPRLDNVLKFDGKLRWIDLQTANGVLGTIHLKKDLYIFLKSRFGDVDKLLEENDNLLLNYGNNPTEEKAISIYELLLPYTCKYIGYK